MKPLAHAECNKSLEGNLATWIYEFAWKYVKIGYCNPNIHYIPLGNGDASFLIYLIVLLQVPFGERAQAMESLKASNPQNGGGSHLGSAGGCYRF